MRLRPRTFIGDGGIEGGEIDHAYRLRAKHERIVANAFSVNLRGYYCRTDVVQAPLRVGFDAAVEQMGGNRIDRILQTAAHRVETTCVVTGVSRTPIILLACTSGLGGSSLAIGPAAASTDRRQRDWIAEYESIRLETL